MTPEKKPSMITRILRALLMGVLALLIAAAFYLAVIMGEPQENEAAIRPRTDQPLLEAAQAINITREEQLSVLRDAFPAPLLQAVPDSGLTLTAGTAYNTAFEAGYGRIVTLSYASAAGQPLTVTSIYPARALELLEKGDYTLAAITGQTLAGMKAVRMENGSSIRLHAQGEEGIYVVTAPQMSSGELVGILRALQLFEGE